MRKRFSARQWAAWFDEFDRDDVTVAEFCQRIGVSHNSYYAWRRKLKQPTDKQNGQQELNDHFALVVMTPDHQVKIEFPCGAVLRVDCRVDTIRPVLQTLAQLGGKQS